MRSNSKLITVTLGEQQASIDRRLASGEYKSASDVIQAGLRALDREEAAVSGIMGDRVRAAFVSPGPDIAAEDVFTRLRAHHAAQATLEQAESRSMPWALLDATGDSSFMPDGRE